MAGAPRSSRKVATPKPAVRQNDDWRSPYDDDALPGTHQGDYPSDDDYGPSDSNAFAPRLTLPSMPIAARARVQQPRREDSGRHRTLLDATSRQPAVRQSSPGYPRSDDSLPGASGARRRENSTARPLKRILTPSIPRSRQDAVRIESWDREERRDDRALIPVMPQSPDLVPNLAAFRPRAAARIRADTRALVRHAGSPWSLTRLILALAAITAAVLTALVASGEPAEPLMSSFGTTTGSTAAIAVASMVTPETQIERPDLYDSYTQFLNWKGAACSAAALSEILTAWGVQNANIGKVIDTMNSGSAPNISPNLGLLRSTGFQYAADKFGYRADLGTNFSLTYGQILYLTNVLGVPVIINVRISWGYYHFFDGGHFLVVTGGDSQGVKIVDSSTYYIHYLQKDVLYSMFTGVTAVVVPKDFHYTVPKV